MKDYKVTVICIAFNHGRYIENTLRSFVMQKTNFAFKVIVHDDASTDNTRSIIEKYEKAYPDIVFPIYQTENQYSKGTMILRNVVMPRVDTEYIAFCEGDDFWTDENKLQMQYDYMTANPDCALCTHNTNVISGKDDAFLRTINPNAQDKDYSTDEIILARGSGLFHTSSFFMRTDAKREFPDELRIKGVGDYPLAVYLSLRGRTHYFGKVMSSYRTGVQGSWTVKTYASKEKTRKLYDNLHQYLERLNQYTNGQYEEAIQKTHEVNLFLKHRFLGEYRKILLDKKMRSVLRSRPYYEKKEVLLRGLVPFAFKVKNMLKRLRRK